MKTFGIAFVLLVTALAMAEAKPKHAEERVNENIHVLHTDRANENIHVLHEYEEGFKTPGSGFAYNPNAVITQAHEFTPHDSVFRDDGDDEEEDEDEVAMDISETKRCYVYGQCQEYSIDFKHTDDVEQCHKFCGKKGEECGWWSWEPELNLCLLYTNCTEEGVDPPAVEPCPECISGQRLCPARECHGAFKCQGNFVDSYAIATLEECIEKCHENEDCQWFTLEKANDHCIIYEECNDQFDCETCATGERHCSRGYHGTTPAPARAAREAATNEDGSAVIVGTAQSTKWAWNSPTGTSPRLIDGKGIDGRWSSIGCAGTSDAYRPEKLIESAGREWFSLELDAPQKIARVQIAKRTDCCSERARNIQITIGPSKGYDPNEPLCLPEIDSLAGPGMQEYVCEGELHEGKFVKISRAGVMNLCEVKIFAA